MAGNHPGSLNRWQEALLNSMAGRVGAPNSRRIVGQQVVDTGQREALVGQDGWAAEFTDDTLDVVSSSAGDADGGAGVNSIRLIGINATGDEVSEDVTLDGLTPVTTTATFHVLNEMVPLAFGANDDAVGNIDVTRTTGGAFMGRLASNERHGALGVRGMVGAGRLLAWELEAQGGPVSAVLYRITGAGSLNFVELDRIVGGGLMGRVVGVVPESLGRFEKGDVIAVFANVSAASALTLAKVDYVLDED